MVVSLRTGCQPRLSRNVPNLGHEKARGVTKPLRSVTNWEDGKALEGACHAYQSELMCSKYRRGLAETCQIQEELLTTVQRCLRLS